MKTSWQHRKALFAGFLLAGGAVATVAILWERKGAEKAGPAEAAAPGLPELALPAEAPGAGKMARDDLREALDSNGSLAPQQRLDILASLPGELSPADCEALLRALLEPRPADASAGWHAEYFHQIAGLLQRSDGARERFAQALATVARDAQRGAIVRDYALQHLRQVWDRADAKLRAPVEATFREVAAGDPALASSALLSLHLLGTPAGRDPLGAGANPPPPRGKAIYRIPDAELAPLVAKILAEPPSADTVTPRLSALRIIGDRRMRNFRDDLRRIAADATGEPAMVRMAAIANLGRVADPADRAFLESIDSSGDGRVANAVRHALASLR